MADTSIPSTALKDLEAAIAGAGTGGVSSDTNLLPGLANIGAFFDKLGEANTWIRVAEILLGAALILTGVAKLLSGTSVGQAAGQAAGTAAKGAAL